MTGTTTNTTNYNTESDHDKLIRIEQIMVNNYKNASDMNKTTSEEIQSIRIQLEKITALMSSNNDSLEKRLSELEIFKNSYMLTQSTREKRYSRTIALISSLSAIIAVLIVFLLMLSYSCPMHFYNCLP